MGELITAEESNEILKRNSPRENIKAMRASEGDMKKKHSDLILGAGDIMENIFALEHSEGHMKKRHRKRIEELMKTRDIQHDQE